MGKKKKREELEEELKENPPLLCGEKLKVSSQGTYLGDELGLTVSESASLTINKRVGLVKKAIFEIKFIIEDCRSKVIGAINTGMMIWESCIIPFLLNNCSTWLEIRQSDVDKLVKLQNLFLSSLLGIQNCPAVMMYGDLCVLTIPHRILKEKLILYHHISTLPEQALAHRILDTQERHQLRGLSQEVRPFLSRHQVIDVKSFSKIAWKDFDKHNMSNENRDFLIQWSEKYKKVDSLSLACEDYSSKQVEI